jgi:hypothetical protein
MLIRIVVTAINFGGCDFSTVFVTRIWLPACNPTHARTRYFPNTLIYYTVLLGIDRSVKSNMLHFVKYIFSSVFYKEWSDKWSE